MSLQMKNIKPSGIFKQKKKNVANQSVLVTIDIYCISQNIFVDVAQNKNDSHRF